MLIFACKRKTNFSISGNNGDQWVIIKLAKEVHLLVLPPVVATCQNISNSKVMTRHKITDIHVGLAILWACDDVKYLIQMVCPT